MTHLPSWLYPSSPQLPGQVRDVLLFGAMADDDDLTLREQQPLKRARRGSIPLPGTEMRACFDAVPIWPEAITSRSVGEIAGVDSKRAGTVLAMLADRKIAPPVRRVRVEGVLHWTRDK